MAVILTVEPRPGTAATSDDALAASCWDLGCMGIEERDGQLLVAFTDEAAASRAAASLPAGAVRSSRAVGDALAGWTAPQAVIPWGRFVICPSALQVPPSDPESIVITIDAGRAFGSGSHASTRLALGLVDRAMTARAEAPGPSVLDIGTGTGVLAIAAARLGAGSVRAVDNDADARGAARTNVDLNDLGDRITVDETDVEALVDRYDVVIANLTIDVHEALAPTVEPRIAPGGELIAAGVSTHEQQTRLARLYPTRHVTDRAHEGDWVALRLATR